MSQKFELWDRETANLVGVYDTIDAALDLVSRSLLAFGPSSVETLALTLEDGENAQVIPHAANLIELAERAACHQTASSRLT